MQFTHLRTAEIHLCTQFDPGLFWEIVLLFFFLILFFRFTSNMCLLFSLLIIFHCFSWGVNYEEYFCLLTEMELKILSWKIYDIQPITSGLQILNQFWICLIIKSLTNVIHHNNFAEKSKQIIACTTSNSVSQFIMITQWPGIR